MGYFIAMLGIALCVLLFNRNFTTAQACLLAEFYKLLDFL